MPIKPNEIPDSMLRCMGKKHRPKGNAGMTQAEAGAKQNARLEKEVHVQIENWLRINGIVAIHSRMDKKATVQRGLPDFVFVWRGYGDVGSGEHPTLVVPVAVEVKTGSRMSQVQEAVRTQMEENGWNYYVVGTLQEVIDLVRNL